jgi:hypothetical protein
MNHSRTVALNVNSKQGNTMFAQFIPCARSVRNTAAALGLLMATGFALTPVAAQAATSVTISGEISRITLTTPGDYWSAGTMVISGQYVTIPRNLLIDLAANRLTLWQFFDQAPAACKALGETGLTSTDRCNTSGTGAYASIAANRTNGGNIIAGVDPILDPLGLAATAGPFLAGIGGIAVLRRHLAGVDDGDRVGERILGR